MSVKQQSKRNTRKALLRQFETTFNLDRLNYDQRIKPGKAKAKITGLMFASAIYLAAFGLAYFSWSRHLIDDTLLMKISWIVMVPASAVGALAFLIASNRKEFPIREDIRAHVRDFEGSEGMLWRYGPILKGITLKKIYLPNLIEASREGRLVEMAPEDICASIQAIHIALNQGAPGPAISEVEKNLAPSSKAA